MPDSLLTIDNMYKSLMPGRGCFRPLPELYGDEEDVEVTSNGIELINEWLYRSKISRYPKVWDELNFVRCVVRRHLIDRRANFAFEGSVMHDLMARAG
jgi:hypothetical protein